MASQPSSSSACQVRLILDTLGDDAKVELVGEFDRCVHDRRVGRLATHVRHERAVDLDQRLTGRWRKCVSEE